MLQLAKFEISLHTCWQDLSENICALEQETLTVKCDHRGNRTFATTLSGLHTSASQWIQVAQLLGEVGKAQSERGVTPCEEAVHHDCTRMKGQNATQWGGGSANINAIF